MSRQSNKQPVEVTSTVSLTEAQIAAIKAVNENINITSFSNKSADQITEEQWKKTQNRASK